MYPHITAYIADDPSGLTPIAQSFLAQETKRGLIGWGDDKDEVLSEYRENFDGDGTEFWDFLHYLRMRYGGLSYESRGWVLSDVAFQPFAELDPEDGMPLVSLIESFGSPVGVFASLDGAIHYFPEGVDDPRPVRVFPSVDALIESCAMYADSEGWIEVAGGRGEDLDAVVGQAGELDLLTAPSGTFEWWWEGAGVRVHASKTIAELRSDPSEARWKVWARDESGVSAARHFAGRS
ncbi:hypothetical protein ACH437_03710 [Streptomyces xinghaiensis]|uniref:hypothetical protein n=1 Tax=Streptomyces xinghaiensis TaxID=1038928 RepID=UPI0037A3E627